MVDFGHVAGQLILVITAKSTEREKYSGNRQGRGYFWAKANGLARLWAETGFQGLKNDFQGIPAHCALALHGLQNRGPGYMANIFYAQ